MFTKIEIEIELNDEMKTAMPKSGSEEMKVIDEHSAAIEEATGKWLEGVVQDLEALGYKVSIDS